MKMTELMDEIEEANRMQMQRVENVSIETLLNYGPADFDARATGYSKEFGEPRIGAILALICAASDFYEDECGAGIQMDAADDLLNATCEMLRSNPTPKFNPFELYGGGSRPTDNHDIFYEWQQRAHEYRQAKTASAKAMLRKIWDSGGNREI